LPGRQRAAALAGLLRCVGTGERMKASSRRPCRPAAKLRSRA
jgi:hypothetical protein